MTVETIPAQLSADEARACIERIRETAVTVHDARERLREWVARAYLGRAWVALGYASWDALCDAELGDDRMRLPRSERQELVASLREQGMSTRAIGSALGVSHMTVERDAAASSSVTDVPVERVVSLDGRQRPAVQPPRTPSAPTTESPTPVEEVVDAEVVEDEPVRVASVDRAAPRRPLADAFADATYDLAKTVDRLTRLTADDRFPRNADQVATKHRSDLIRAMDALTDVLNRLPQA